MDTVKSIVGTVQTQLTDQASLIYDQVKSAITTKLDKIVPKKVEATQESKQEPSKEKPADSFDSPPAEPEDPDSFSFSRILDKVWYYIKQFIYPLLCVLMASFITNEMMMYAPIIRFTFFVFFLLVCLSSTGILSSMCVYYLLKLIYGIYVNKMTDRPKIKLLPTLYSILPLIVDRPLMPIAALFLYPFTYPKTQVDEKALLETMALYQKNLDRSYPAVSSDVMPDKVTKAKEYLKHMHDTPKQTEQKGYIEELKKIVPNPGKFHAPIGKVQIEAREKAKEMATAVAVAATSMPSQPPTSTSNSTLIKPSAPLPPVIGRPPPAQQVSAPMPPFIGQQQAAQTTSTSLPPVIGQQQAAQTTSTALPAVIRQGSAPPSYNMQGTISQYPQQMPQQNNNNQKKERRDQMIKAYQGVSPPPPSYNAFPNGMPPLENTQRTPQ